MNPTIDILRAELERLFSLDEMTSMSERLLGLDPQDVGGATGKASFAKALAERCIDGDRIDALADVLLAWRPGVDPPLRDVAGLCAKEELAPGGILEPVAALHKARIAHGDLKLENVLVGRATPSVSQGEEAGVPVTLVDFGTDRLRHRSVGSNGHGGALAVFGSPRRLLPNK